MVQQAAAVPAGLKLFANVLRSYLLAYDNHVTYFTQFLPEKLVEWILISYADSKTIKNLASMPMSRYHFQWLSIDERGRWKLDAESKLHFKFEHALDNGRYISRKGYLTIANVEVLDVLIRMGSKEEKFKIFDETYEIKNDDTIHFFVHFAADVEVHIEECSLLISTAAKVTTKAAAAAAAVVLNNSAVIPSKIAKIDKGKQEGNNAGDYDGRQSNRRQLLSRPDDLFAPLRFSTKSTLIASFSIPISVLKLWFSGREVGELGDGTEISLISFKDVQSEEETECLEHCEIMDKGRTSGYVFGSYPREFFKFFKEQKIGALEIARHAGFLPDEDYVQIMRHVQNKDSPAGPGSAKGAEVQVGSMPSSDSSIPKYLERDLEIAAVRLSSRDLEKMAKLENFQNTSFTDAQLAKLLGYHGKENSKGSAHGWIEKMERDGFLIKRKSSPESRTKGRASAKGSEISFTDWGKAVLEFAKSHRWI